MGLVGPLLCACDLGPGFSWDGQAWLRPRGLQGLGAPLLQEGFYLEPSDPRLTGPEPVLLGTSLQALPALCYLRVLLSLYV